MGIPERYKHINFVPPTSVASAATKGLKLRRKQTGDKAGLTPSEASKEGIGSGVQRASNLKNRDTLSPDTIKQMAAFFSRHEKNKTISAKNKKTPWKDNGYVSWLLWGGDPGQTWAKKVLSQMEAADKKDKKKASVWRRFASEHLPSNPRLWQHLASTRGLEEGLKAFQKAGGSWRKMSYTEREGLAAVEAFSAALRRLDASMQGDRYKELAAEYGSDWAVKHALKSVFTHLINTGKSAARYVIENKKIPKKARKAVAALSNMARVPNKPWSWWVKHENGLRMLTNASQWSRRKEGTNTIFKYGPFEVHNVGNFDVDIIDNGKKIIDDAVKKLKASPIKGVQDILNGRVFFSKKLRGDQTKAWYYPGDDTIYVRPTVQRGATVLHDLIHELAHKYWKHKMSADQKRQWIQHHHRLLRATPDFEPDLSELDKLNGLKVGDVFPFKVVGFVKHGPPRVLSIKKVGGTTVYRITDSNGKTGTISRYGLIQSRIKAQEAQAKMSMFPSAYASSNPEEHFAESFALLAQKKLPKEHLKPFEAIVL